MPPFVHDDPLSLAVRELRDVEGLTEAWLQVTVVCTDAHCWQLCRVCVFVNVQAPMRPFVLRAVLLLSACVFVTLSDHLRLQSLVPTSVTY